MYSYEISQLLAAKNNNIDSETYIHICNTSPQIKRGKYNPCENNFEIWTDDNYYWKFTVFCSSP